MSGVSSNDIMLILGGFAGTAYAIFGFFLAVLSFFIPLMIFFIHRSTRRTAIAVEKIARQNEQLIDLMSNGGDFSFEEFRNESS